VFKLTMLKGPVPDREVKAEVFREAWGFLVFFSSGHADAPVVFAVQKDLVAAIERV
jgi:hypothetical protein